MGTGPGDIDKHRCLTGRSSAENLVTVSCCGLRDRLDDQRPGGARDHGRGVDFGDLSRPAFQPTLNQYYAATEREQTRLNGP